MKASGAAEGGEWAERVCVAKNRRRRRPGWRQLASRAPHLRTPAVRMPSHRRSRAAT